MFFTAIFDSMYWQLLAQRVVESATPASPAVPLPPPSDLSFWRDPIWQSIGVIVGTIGVAITLWFGFQQFQKKALSYEIISRENLVKITNKALGRDLKILYKNRPIDNLFLITIKIINSGNIPIRRDDYDGDAIKIRFSQNSEILVSEIVEQLPKNLNAVIVQEPISSTVIVKPLLLNKGDFFVVQVLVTSLKTLDIDARIAGIKKIKNVNESIESRENIFLQIGIVFIGVAILFWLFKYSLVEALFLLLIGMVTLFYFNFSRK